MPLLSLSYNILILDLFLKQLLWYSSPHSEQVKICKIKGDVSKWSLKHKFNQRLQIFYGSFLLIRSKIRNGPQFKQKNKHSCRKKTNRPQYNKISTAVTVICTVNLVDVNTNEINWVSTIIKPRIKKVHNQLVIHK